LTPGMAQILAQHGQIVVLILNYALWSLLIGWGSSYFGVFLVAAGLLSLVTSTIYCLQQGRVISPALMSCWLSIAIILAWVALFWSHTLVHPFFMGRLLLIPVLSGIVAACVTAPAQDATPRLL
jgi:hypothetical protein